MNRQGILVGCLVLAGCTGTPRYDPTRSLVAIHGAGLGSGVIVGVDGPRVYVLSVEHAAKHSPQPTVSGRDGMVRPGTWIAHDEEHDLALLRFIWREPVTVAVVSPANDFARRPVVIVGHLPVPGSPPHWTSGHVVGPTGDGRLLLSGWISMGYSGGPVLDEVHGDIVGVITSYWMISGPALPVARPLHMASMAVSAPVIRKFLAGKVPGY